MDDPAIVGEIESFADLEENRHSGPGILDHPGVNQWVEVVTGEKLLDDIWDVVFDTEVEDQGDVPVNEITDELGFLVESLTHLFIWRGAHLDRDGTFDEGIPSLVDDPESTGRYLGRNLIFADPFRGLHCLTLAGFDAGDNRWASPVETPRSCHTWVR